MLSLTRLVYRSRVVIRLTICYVYIYFTPCIVYTIGNRDSFVPPVFLRSGRRKNKCVLKVPFVYTLYIPYYESIELSNNFSYSFFFFFKNNLFFFFSFPLYTRLLNVAPPRLEGNPTNPDFVLMSAFLFSIARWELVKMSRVSIPDKT